MSVFGKIWDGIKAAGGFVGNLLARGLKLAKEAGLDDQLVALALVLVRGAAKVYVTDAEKRAYVVQKLKDQGVPEGVARIALQLALLIYKAEFPDEAAADTAPPPTEL